MGGVGVLWHAAAATTVAFRAAGGPNNVALARSDISAEVLHYGARVEGGANIRRLTFDGVDLVALSPIVVWVPDDVWRLDVRYTYSRSSFNATDESQGDHSIALRQTWQRWRRTALIATYAYGIESFEDLTTERVASLGATTAAAGVRVDLRSLTRITAMWEHQWRSNDSRIDRVTASIVQSVR
jgi:hypothetical protein